MKFTTSTALLALSTAAFVAAAPVVKRTPTTSAANSDFSQVIGDTADSDLFAALLDPTFVDENGDVEVGEPASSSQAASSSTKPFTLHFGIPAQSTAKAAGASTSSVIKYTTPTPVVVSIPGKTSTAYTTRATGGAGAVNAANVGSPVKVSSQPAAAAQKPAGGYTSTVVVPSSKMVVVTVPGKTKTTTSYYYYHPTAAAKPSSSAPAAAAKPSTTAAAINPANVGSPIKASSQPPVAIQKPATNAAAINPANVGSPVKATPTNTFVTMTIPGRTSTMTSVTRLAPNAKGFTSYVTAKPTQH